MNRSLVYLLTLTLLALVACAPPALSAEPNRIPAPQTSATVVTGLNQTPLPVPTVALATPDLSRLESSLALGDPGQGNQAAQELTNWARDASGVRDALGPQADEIFDLADQAENAAAQELLRRLQSGSKPKGMPAPLPPRWREFPGQDDLENVTNLLSMLALAPGRLASPPNPNPNPNPVNSAQEVDQALGENARAHAKITSTVAGSKIQAQVEMTIRSEKDGKVYEERMNGKISVDLCPDPEGSVLLDLTLQTQAGTGAQGYGIQFSDHAMGHVDDEANLTSVDQDIQTEVSFTKGTNWLTGGPDTSFAQVNISFTMGGLASQDSKHVAVTNLRTSVPRSSFFVSQEVGETAAKTGMGFAMVAEAAVFGEAQSKWQTGYCVALAVPEGEAQQVMKGSETPFTAIVRHKFEGKELTVPVIATLTGGKVSVTPSGIKVPAPATFRYKAPEEPWKDATVELISRSRRGIAKFQVAFTTKDQFYAVDTSWAGSEIRLTGSICAWDKPFTLKLGGHKPNGTPYTGKVEFSPQDATTGSWMATGSYSLPNAGTTRDSGGSTYQVTGLAGGKPEIALSAFTQTGVLTLPPEITRVIPAGPIVTTYDWPGMEIPLITDSGSCSSE